LRELLSFLECLLKQFRHIRIISRTIRIRIPSSNRMRRLGQVIVNRLLFWLIPREAE
jgi:hypothetical protein